MPASAFTRHVDDDITIRRAESLADYRACQDAQRGRGESRKKAMSSPSPLWSARTCTAAWCSGRFCLTARRSGMSFGFLGRVEGRFCLYSQLTGVVPGFQSQGWATRSSLPSAISPGPRDSAHRLGL